DLAVLSSTGTHVVKEADGEYIVSTLDGFLTLDTKSNKVSVTEKIESKGGISIKTTGDLALGVDEFIEHGEVQEGRAVRGKHMTFRSNVFGSVLSKDGNITIDGNLAGGRAESQEGNVTLGGRASRAVIRAPNGNVQAKYCESCTIVGKVVRVEHAINCEIIADELQADLVEGSMVAGKTLKLASTGERRGTETLVTMLIPDMSGFEQSIAKLNKEIADAQSNIAAKKRESEAAKADPEFVKFMGLAARIKSGAIKLTAEQTVNWRKLVEKNAKAHNQVVKLDGDISALESALKAAEEELSYVIRDRDAVGGNVSCTIEKVAGHTTGQSMKSSTGVGAFSTMSGNDIKALLQKPDAHKKRIFSTDSGAINWKFR
ncbi:MAG TPA: hypothetical protein VFW53_04720, partial [Gallionella sp.]|nr:hypothetical protein [Gallionella sp.]